MRPILEILRQLLTAGGGVLLGGSSFEADDISTIAGAIATVVGVLWTVYDRSQRRKRRDDE
jgi:hypothetical protein